MIKGVRELPGLIRDLFFTGGVVVSTPPAAAGEPSEAGPTFTTTVQWSGDLIVRVVGNAWADPGLWSSHVGDIHRRLRPLSILRRAFVLVPRWIAVAASVLGVGQAILRWELSAWTVILAGGGLAMIPLPLALRCILKHRLQPRLATFGDPATEEDLRRESDNTVS